MRMSFQISRKGAHLAATAGLVLTLTAFSGLTAAHENAPFPDEDLAAQAEPPSDASPVANVEHEVQTAAVEEHPAFTQTGKASWYGRDFHGRKTASGVRFDQNALTAAHRTLPLGTAVKVTSLETGRTVLVQINDRGPYIRGRIIDLSKRAALDLGMEDVGVVPVKVETVSTPALPEKTTAHQEEAPVAEPTAKAPVVEEPTAKAPVVEEPAVEEPAAEAPVPEIPAVEAPIAKAPVMEASAVEAPVVETPAVEVAERPDQR